MHGALLAVVHPDNTPHGANLTFAVPVLVFVIVSAALFLRFRAPHAVPGRVAFKSSRWATAGTSGQAAFGGAGVDAAVGTQAEPVAPTTDAPRTDAPTTDAPVAQAAAPGTVQSGTEDPATGTAGDQAESEQVTPADESTEDGE